MEQVKDKPNKLFLVLFLTGLILTTIFLLAPLVFIYSISPILAFVSSLFLSTIFSFIYIFLDKKKKSENAQLITISLSILYQYLAIPVLFQALIYYAGLENFFLISLLYLALMISFAAFIYYNKAFPLFVYFWVLIFSSKEERDSGAPIKKIQYLLKTPL